MIFFKYFNFQQIRSMFSTFINSRNQRRNVDNLNQMQKSLYASLKRSLPDQDFGKYQTFSEQMKRRQRISDTCQKFANPEGEDFADTYFKGRSPNFSQTIRPESFLIAKIPPSVLCYNHKVASTTWMSAFAQLLGDEAYFQELLRTKAFYKWVYL